MKFVHDTAQIGDTKYVLIGTDYEIEKERKKLRRKARKLGEVIHWKDGLREYWVKKPIFDTSRSGSSRYTWDASGERVRCHVTHCLVREGETTRRRLRDSWMLWDAL